MFKSLGIPITPKLIIPFQCWMKQEFQCWMSRKALGSVEVGSRRWGWQIFGVWKIQLHHFWGNQRFFSQIKRKFHTPKDFWPSNPNCASVVSLEWVYSLLIHVFIPPSIPSRIQARLEKRWVGSTVRSEPFMIL